MDSRILAPKRINRFGDSDCVSCGNLSCGNDKVINFRHCERSEAIQKYAIPDGNKVKNNPFFSVIPAQAGIQKEKLNYK
ncbi:MAG: hypothetical protein LBC08_03820 [Campylobacteraceae bacterium]|jgi:hypothetical protein|nr:hypothetical protein [Campylobacteraceae bacterium]